MCSEFFVMMRRFQTGLTAILAFAAMATPMAAQAMDWYSGLSLGQARHEATGGDIVGPGYTGTVDGNDNGWKVFLGMELWEKYVGAEFGYFNLGKANTKGTSSGVATTATSEAETFTAALAGFIPIGSHFGTVIKLGLTGPRAEVKITKAGVTTTTSTTDLKVFGGIGAQFDFSKSMSARLEVERFNMGSIGSPYVNLISAGLIYRFGK